jgi:REP element-mobilizing transposase RayT
LGCEVVELNVQPDHVHLLVKIIPKVSISEYMGAIKGRTAIRIFKQFPYLRERPYWGNHFWAQGDNSQRAFYEGTLPAPLWGAKQSPVLWAGIQPPFTVE